MTKQQIENTFTYHRPFGTQPAIYGRLREMAKDLATFINDNCPESREKSLAFTSLQQAIMWANASIAINSEEIDPQSFCDWINDPDRTPEETDIESVYKYLNNHFVDFRIVREDGDYYPCTADVQQGRINLEVDQMKVTKAYLG